MKTSWTLAACNTILIVQDSMIQWNYLGVVGLLCMWGGLAMHVFNGRAFRRLTPDDSSPDCRMAEW